MTFYDDGGAEMLNETERHRHSDGGDTLRRLLFHIFKDTDRHLADEECRHTYTFSVPQDVLALVEAHNQIKIAEDGDCVSDVDPQMEKMVDDI